MTYQEMKNKAISILDLIDSYSNLDDIVGQDRKNLIEYMIDIMMTEED